MLFFVLSSFSHLSLSLGCFSSASCMHDKHITKNERYNFKINSLQVIAKIKHNIVIGINETMTYFDI